MHQTLDASVAALVGELPAVAPVVEDPDAPAIAAAPPRRAVGAETVEALRHGLQDVMRRIQQLVDDLAALDG
jgi:uncharacterized protein